MAILYDKILAGNSRDMGHRAVSKFMLEKQGILFEEFSYFAFKKGLDIVGAMIFCNYNGKNVDIHVHLPRMLNKKTIRIMMNYAFKQLECSRMTATVLSNNHDVQVAMVKIGFMHNSHLPFYYGENNSGEMYYITPQLADRWIN